MDLLTLLERCRKDIRELDPIELSKTHEKYCVIDVREDSEVESGVIPGSLHLSRGFLELKIEAIVPNKREPILVYCAGGVRSILAAQALHSLGYQSVASLRGGFNEWKKNELPVFKRRLLSSQERAIYGRHISIPEIGEAGQVRLLESKVLIIGAGGLGCPTGIYLAGAGVGTLGIADFDRVELSNLHRQILHKFSSVGALKTKSFKSSIEEFNPAINVVEHACRIEKSNILELISKYDLVIDASDNFSTRYLINDACLLAQKPLIHGSIFRFEGQVTVFDKIRGGPCYRCLFPFAPPPGLAPSCAEAGVFGVLPGMIGVAQATEAIKMILGIGDPLIGKLWSYDALSAEVNILEYGSRKDCICSLPKQVALTSDSSAACGLSF